MPKAAEKVIIEVGEPSEFRTDDSYPRFVVSPFNPEYGALQYEIKRELNHIPQNCIGTNNSDCEFRESSKEEYEAYVSRIKEALQNATNEKIVASRRLRVPLRKDVEKLFSDLCQAYPDDFIFFISTKEFGNWIGASPELLLKKRGQELRSMALAGTRKNGDKGSWDEKNIAEQSTVEEYIVNTLGQNGCTVEVEEKTIKKAGEVEHIMTPIQAFVGSSTNLLHLINELSPTPALSGYPKKKALDVITQNEDDRQLYGGFCGPVSSNGDFDLYVVLRCGKINFEKGNVTLFAGGGITKHSIPELEWVETENKLKTLKNKL